jgi:hypothetical protein
VSRVTEQPFEDRVLVQRFEDRTLPLEQWTHRAHVKVAFTYLREHSFDEALQRMRAGVQAFNTLHGVPNTPTSGYNETTTVAFLRLIAATMQAYGEAFPTPDGEAFCNTHPHLLHKQVLRLFYSPARRMLPEAKTRFIEPDLAPLPRA